MPGNAALMSGIAQTNTCTNYSFPILSRIPCNTELRSQVQVGLLNRITHAGKCRVDVWNSTNQHLHELQFSHSFPDPMQHRVAEPGSSWPVEPDYPCREMPR